MKNQIDQARWSAVLAATGIIVTRTYKTNGGNYVNSSLFYMEAIDSGLDNPFRCEVCNEEYDELAYEG